MRNGNLGGDVSGDAGVNVGIERGDICFVWEGLEGAAGVRI